MGCATETSEYFLPFAISLPEGRRILESHKSQKRLSPIQHYHLPVWCVNAKIRLQVKGLIGKKQMSYVKSERTGLYAIQEQMEWEDVETEIVKEFRFHEHFMQLYGGTQLNSSLVPKLLGPEAALHPWLTREQFEERWREERALSTYADNPIQQEIGDVFSAKKNNECEFPFREEVLIPASVMDTVLKVQVEDEAFRCARHVVRGIHADTTRNVTVDMEVAKWDKYLLWVPCYGINDLSQASCVVNGLNGSLLNRDELTLWQKLIQNSGWFKNDVQVMREVIRLSNDERQWKRQRDAAEEDKIRQQAGGSQTERIAQQQAAVSAHARAWSEHRVRAAAGSAANYERLRGQRHRLWTQQQRTAAEQTVEQEFYYSRKQSQQKQGADSLAEGTVSTLQQHFQLLGLEPGASSKDVRKAFRKIAHKLHPDVRHAKSGDTKQDSEQFSSLLISYQTCLNHARAQEERKSG